MCLTMYLKCYFSIIFLQFSIIFGVPKASKKYCKIGVFRYFTVLSKIGRSGGIRSITQSLFYRGLHGAVCAHYAFRSKIPLICALALLNCSCVRWV